MKKIIYITLFLLCAAFIFGSAAAFDKTEKSAGTSVIGMANPWTETDPAGLMETLGLQFDVPEGAEKVVYRMLESDKLAEMQFELYGMPFTARIKPAGTELEDISGLYYDWEYEETMKGDFTRRWYQEEHKKTHDGDDIVEVYLWFDIVPGLTYSLSTKAPDLDGFDIIAVAEMVCHPVQGNS